MGKGWRNQDAVSGESVEAGSLRVVRSREALQEAITRPALADHQARLGELLLRAGFVDDAQLQRALEAQQGQGRGARLGEVLLSQGTVTPEQIAAALASKLGIPIVDLTNVRPDPEVAALLRPELCHRHRALPLFAQGARVVVAMADPLDREGAEAVRLAVGRELEPVLAPEEAIRKATQELRRSGDGHANPFNGTHNGADIVEAIVSEAVGMDVTDVHFIPERERLNIQYRMRGDLIHAHTLGDKQRSAVLNRIKVASGFSTANVQVPQDGVINFQIADRVVEARTSVVPTIHGESAVIRLFDPNRVAASLEALGYDAPTVARLRDMTEQPNGLFLVSGPTGSGKTTLLMAMAREVVRSGRKLMTAEDPVEYPLAGAVQMRVNPETGFTFAAALRGMLRQDADVLLVGEIRDAETAELAAAAALTGRLVLASTHAPNAAGTVLRMLDLGVEDYQLRSSLCGVISQRLVRNTARGRTPIYEFMTVDRAVRESIRRGHDEETIAEVAERSGMETFACRVRQALAAGEIAAEVAEPLLRD